MKKALVLGGGAAKGAFQAGVIYNLAKEKSWDMVIGVSAGAINGAMISMFDKSDCFVAASKLLNHWENDIDENSIYKKWIKIDALNYIIAYWKNGLYNTKPLKKFLEANLLEEEIKKSDVDFFIGTTSFTSGQYRMVNKKEKNIIDWIMASASFPIAFPPIKLEEEFYIDGAIRNAVPIKEAILLGAKKVDVIITDPFGGHVKTNKKPDNVLDMFVRTAEILSDEVFVSDLKECCYRHDAEISIYSPESYLTNNPLDFSKNKIQEMLKLGLEIKTPYIVKKDS